MRARLTRDVAGEEASHVARRTASAGQHQRRSIVHHLQRTIGNRAVSGMVRPSIQRLIITKDLDKDVEYEKVKRFLVEVMSVADRTAAPGEGVKITETDPNELLYILQHGGQPQRKQPGTVMGWSPEQLLEILKTMGFEPAKHKGDIQLLSCYSAFTLTDKPADQSFAQRFATLLRNKDNNYSGSVWGVSGSLNPRYVGPPKTPITAKHLWQSDPTYIRMQEIDTLRTSYSEPFYVIEDYIEGTETEQKPGEWKNTLRKYVDEALWAVNVADHAIDGLAELPACQEKFKEWRNRQVDALRATLAIVTDGQTDNLSPNDLADKEPLREAIETNRNLIVDFEAILQGYREAREEQGYEFGLTGALFKPLAMVRF